MYCHWQEPPYVFIYLAGYWGCRNNSMCTLTSYYWVCVDKAFRHTWVHTDAGYDYVVKIQFSSGSVLVLLDISFGLCLCMCVFDGKFSTCNLKHSITTDAPLVLVLQRKQCIHPERDNILQHLHVSYPGLHLHLMKCPLVPWSTHSFCLPYTLRASTLPYWNHCAAAIMNCILYS